MRASLMVALGALAVLSWAGAAEPAAKPSESPDPDPLEIPASARDLHNPLAASEDSLRAGRALWQAHCESCHGPAGKGDGPNARLHELRKGHQPQDLTDPKLQSNLTDGELFWRISKGIIEDGDNIIMPAYERKLPIEAQRWEIVLYVRELGRAAADQAERAPRQR